MNSANTPDEVWQFDREAVSTVTLEHSSESELMQEIAAGDQNAFEKLYDHYSPILYGLCLRILKHEFEAREVLSDVFITVWERAAEYDCQRGSVKAFLVTITRSRAIDRLRSLTSKQRNRQRLQNFCEANQPNRPELTEPCHRMMMEEDGLLLRRAIDRLSKIQQQVLQLAFFDGKTHCQISEELRLPLGTVKSAARRGIAVLRELLPRGEPKSLDT